MAATFNAGAMVRAARERAGLSQAELGQRMTMLPSNVSHLERNATLSSETLARAARALGLELRLVDPMPTAPCPDCGAGLAPVNNTYACPRCGAEFEPEPADETKGNPP